MNFDQFRQRLQKEAEQTQDDVLEATRAVARQMLADAQARVPVVTGDLRDSGRVTTEQDGAGVEFTADYADQVHENPNSAGYRFLESVVDEHSANLPDEIVSEVRRG